MKPRFKRIVKSGDNLQMGHYLVAVDKDGRASILPITSAEESRFIKEILGVKA